MTTSGVATEDEEAVQLHREADGGVNDDDGILRSRLLDLTDMSLVEVLESENPHLVSSSERLAAEIGNPNAAAAGFQSAI